MPKKLGSHEASGSDSASTTPKPSTSKPGSIFAQFACVNPRYRQSALKRSPSIVQEEATSESLYSPPATPKRKRRKIIRGYAPPETYEHLHFLQDYLKEDLDIVFCGINPGYQSAEIGHHYAHPTNHFWPCLHRGGFTGELLPAKEDFTLPDTYSLGLTNLTDRPSKEARELSAAEQEAGVLPLLKKIVRFHPRVVCFLGMNIWELVKKTLIDMVPLPPLPPPSPKSPSETSSQSLPTQPEAKKCQTRKKKLITSKHFPPPPSIQQEKADEAKRVAARRRQLKKDIRQACPTVPGLMPFKIIHEDLTNGVDRLQETLFYSLPSPSARVVHFQLVDKIELFKQFKKFIDQLKDANYNLDQPLVYEVKSSEILAA